jgi:hypothetical protein
LNHLPASFHTATVRRTGKRYAISFTPFFLPTANNWFISKQRLWRLAVSKQNELRRSETGLISDFAKLPVPHS